MPETDAMQKWASNAYLLSIDINKTSLHKRWFIIIENDRLYRLKELFFPIQ